MDWETTCCSYCFFLFQQKYLSPTRRCFLWTQYIFLWTKNIFLRRENFFFEHKIPFLEHKISFTDEKIFSLNTNYLSLNTKYISPKRRCFLTRFHIFQPTRTHWNSIGMIQTNISSNWQRSDLRAENFIYLISFFLLFFYLFDLFDKYIFQPTYIWLTSRESLWQEQIPFISSQIFEGIWSPPVTPEIIC